MTDAILVEIAKQVPALLVLAWVVWKFLGALHQQVDLFTQVIKDVQARQDALNLERGKAVETTVLNCHRFQLDLMQRSETVFGRMEVALMENSKSNGAITEVIQKCAPLRERRNPA